MPKIMWTDVSFAELGDAPLSKGPIREVILVKVELDGTAWVQLPTGSVAVIPSERLYFSPDGFYS